MSRSAFIAIAMMFAGAGPGHAGCPPHKDNGRIFIGMTKEQVLSTCLGKPVHINRTVTATGEHEQFIYPGGYVYFDNGLVSGIQTSK